MTAYVAAPAQPAYMQPLAASIAQPIAAAPPAASYVQPMPYGAAAGSGVPGGVPVSQAGSIRPVRYQRRPIAYRRPSKQRVRFQQRLSPREMRFMGIAGSAGDEVIAEYRLRLDALRVRPTRDGVYRKRDLPSHAHPIDRSDAKKIIRAMNRYIWQLVDSGYGGYRALAGTNVPAAAAVPSAAPLIAADII